MERDVVIPLGAGVATGAATYGEYTLPAEWQDVIKDIVAGVYSAISAAAGAWVDQVLTIEKPYPGATVDAAGNSIAYNGSDKVKIGDDLSVSGALQVVLFARVVESGGVQGLGDGT